MYTSRFISVSMTVVIIVSFLVKTNSVSAQVPGIISPPISSVPDVLSQPADDSKIVVPQLLSGSSGSPHITEIRTFTTEKTVRPDPAGQPSVVYVYLYPEWMAPNLPPGGIPPQMVSPAMYPPAPPWMLPPPAMSPAMYPMMFPPTPPMMWMPPPGMTPPIAAGCFGKNCLGARTEHPMYPPAMEYPNPALLAADPYHATQFTPSVVAPPMVVYPNGVMIKPKVYLPGKFCHNFFQAITP